EGRDGVALPDASADPIERLAVEWSHPRWLVERLAAEVPLVELPELLAAHNRRGPVTVRANPLRTTADLLARELDARGGQAAPARWAPDALVVERAAGRLRGSDAFRAGRFAFQGEASQLVTLLLGVEPGTTALDACAAPGGKTAHAASLAAPGGRVIAIDVHPAGARRIAAEAQRLGLGNVSPLVADVRRPPIGTPLDAVLVDAPCSGLGTLRRHPELRWRRHPDDLARFAALQSALLDAVAPLVRAGGALVYAVCTPMRAETDDVVAAFLDAQPRFVRESPAARLPAAAVALVTPEGALRTWPHRHDLDAFFAVRLRAR